MLYEYRFSFRGGRKKKKRKKKKKDFNFESHKFYAIGTNYLPKITTLRTFAVSLISGASIFGSTILYTFSGIKKKISWVKNKFLREKSERILEEQFCSQRNFCVHGPIFFFFELSRFVEFRYFNYFFFFSKPTHTHTMESSDSSSGLFLFFVFFFFVLNLKIVFTNRGKLKHVLLNNCQKKKAFVSSHHTRPQNSKGFF